ncbi:MAG: aldose epimerase family protein [Eubacteriales bacterium]|nr:aldose epimerase family protein [Eubacteriales bacterium]
MIIKNNTNTKNVYEFILINSKLNFVKISNFGATIMQIVLEDINNKKTDITLGYDTIEEYMRKDNIYYFGATCGRFANRIKNAKFKIGEKEYKLNNNDGNNILHGGEEGFNKKIFNILKIEEENDKNILVLEYFSKDLEMGFPGNLNLSVTFSFDDNDVLSITYEAKSDKDTYVNFTNHTYFNLNGVEESNNIENHYLQIDSKHILELDNEQVPNGKLFNIKNTPFDFTNTKQIGKEINDILLKKTKGYDHNYCLDDTKKSIKVFSELTKIKLEIKTTLNGMQLYTANFLENVKGKKNIIYNKRSGVCFETQHYPNNPNINAFPKSLLKKDEKYISKTEYKFSLM